MADSSDIEDALLENVIKPKSMTTAAGKVDQQDPAALLDVLKQLAAKEAQADIGRGIRFSHITHRGTQG